MSSYHHRLFEIPVLKGGLTDIFIPSVFLYDQHKNSFMLFFIKTHEVIGMNQQTLYINLELFIHKKANTEN